MKLKDIFESDKELTLTAKEKAEGWKIVGGAKVHVGKSRPFKASDRADDHAGDRIGGRRSKTRDSDDGSRGLSAAERNR